MASTRFFNASSFVIAAIALAVLPTAYCSASSPLARSNLHRRLADTVTGAQIPQSCLPSSPPPCMCPIDLNDDTGVLINVYPGYQCAYPGGACTWSDTVRPPFHPPSRSCAYLLRNRTVRFRIRTRRTVRKTRRALTVLERAPVLLTTTETWVF